MRSFLGFSTALLLAAALTSGTANAVKNFNGGAIKKVYAAVAEHSDDFPLTESFQNVPDTSVVVDVPSGKDTLIVTFTAECSLFGSTDGDANWVEVQVRDNGKLMLPSTPPSGSPYAFCGSAFYEGHSIQAVKRVSSGQHTITVRSRITRLNGDTLNANLDDWTLTVLQAE